MRVMSLPVSNYNIEPIRELLLEIEEERLTNRFSMINIKFNKRNKALRRDILYKLQQLNALMVVSTTTNDIDTTEGTWQIELDDDYTEIRNSYFNFGKSNYKFSNYDADQKTLKFNGLDVAVRGLNQVRLCETLFKDNNLITKLGNDEILDDWNLQGEEYNALLSTDLRKPRDAAINLNSKVFHASQGKITELLLTKDSSVELNPKYV